MPARISRSNTVASSSSKPTHARHKNKKRSLDAYATAQKLVPEKRIAKHRLGEIEHDDEGPRQKRSRTQDEDEDEEDDDNGHRRERAARPKRRVNGQDEEDVEYGSDSDGNNWTLGGLAEDDEDSDLDSEEAFGESDEERFAGMTFRGSKSGKLKGKKKSVGRTPRGRPGDDDEDVDLDEGKESEDDSGDSQDDEGLGLGDEAVDLAAMLDDNSHDAHVRERHGGAGDSESGSEDDEEREEDEEGDPVSDSEDDDDDDVEKAEKNARLRDRLDALSGASETQRSSRTQSSTATLHDAFAAFDETEEPAADSSKKSKKRKREIRPTTMAAPLPKRQQDRIDREIAATAASKELDRWLPTVQRNRRAESLTFPLQHPDDQSATIGRDKFQTAAHQAPATELEESIQRIMQESGLATRQIEAGAEDGEDEETALLKAEELAEKHFPVEEVMRRRAELRRARALLFQEEIKTKRIAKIKSKSYRRVHRKERERQAEQEREAMEGLDVNETDKEKHDRQRAQARMSTRHKDSKWAKSLKQTNRSVWDHDARDGVIDQARRNEELKKRIAGRDVSDNEDAAYSSDDEDDQAVLDKLQHEGSQRNGLAGLKFMRTADERQRKANVADIERIRKDLARADGDDVSSDEEEGDGLGRAIFGPSDKVAKQPPKEKLEFEAPEDSDEEDREGADATGPTTEKIAQQKGILKSGLKASGPLAVSGQQPGDQDGTSRSASNPWLSSANGSARKHAAAVEVNLATGDGDLISNGVKPVNSSKQPAPRSTAEAGNTNSWTTVTYKSNDDGNDDGTSDSDPEEPTSGMLSAQEAKMTLQQRAFAGDDVAAAFEAEKADIAASEDEKEVSNHLPGWGSWTGDGLSKSIKRANKKAAHNPLYKTKLPGGVKAADRQDMKKGMEKVIISEKGDRKGKKYLAPVLPHEFETRDQYERSRRLPIGPEWTTKEVHQRHVRPRVVIKKGVNAQALERPLV